MGDRSNLIKFGPEWLRNLSQERTSRTTAATTQTSTLTTQTSTVTTQTSTVTSSTTAVATTSSGSSMPSTMASGASGGNITNCPSGSASTSNAGSSKVQLANLRYGREEMLALYDKNAAVPPELKHNDTLYQARGKTPLALNNTFEDEKRDNLRGGAPTGGLPAGERFGFGRGTGRGLSVNDGRGRPRTQFVRSTSTGRGTTWQVGGTVRAPGFASAADDDSANARSWNTNNGASTSNRNGNDQSVWTSSRVFRKRQGNNTNWRSSREEGEEWRSSDVNRPRSNQDKRGERDWGERPNQDKQPWNSNRRTWLAGDTQNDDLIPEWALGNAESGAGTFDSSGAFHGCSNDDSNLPKTQETPYPLTRSHTHGSFVRSKTIEEGSKEWWASEKAKKLSPKRFDASDVKFKKQISAIQNHPGGHPEPSMSRTESLKSSTIRSESTHSESLDESANKRILSEVDVQKDVLQNKFNESKTFDAMMRSDINIVEDTDERSNFQSVMIASNNSLRQKHQNIVPPVNEASNKQSKQPGMLHVMKGSPTNQSTEVDHGKTQQMPEDKIVEKMFYFTLDDKDMLTKLSSASGSSLVNQTSTGVTSNTSGTNIMASMPNSGMQLRMPNPVAANQNISLVKPIMTTSGIQPPSVQASIMQPSGMQLPGMTGSGMPSGSGLPGSRMHVSNLHTTTMQAPGMQGTVLQAPGMQASAGMQPNIIHCSGIQSSGIQSTTMQASGMQPVGLTNSALNASLGLPLGPANPMGMSLQGVSQPVMPTRLPKPILNSNMMQTASGGLHNFQSNNVPGMSDNNVVNNTLFGLGQNPNNGSVMPPANDMQMSNHGSQSNMFSMHGLQPSSSQDPFGSSVYSNIIQQQQGGGTPQVDQWYYEDPNKNIQGPFTSKEMYNWYRAGFFSPSLMVRRACDTLMHPLGSFGPVVPFAQMNMMQPFSLSGSYDGHSQGSHEPLLNSQQVMGLDMMNVPNMNVPENRMEGLQFGSVNLMMNQTFGQQQMVESVWGQPSQPQDLMWMQQAINSRNENPLVNNLPMFLWEQKPSAIASNSLLPEKIAKEMKTEDQILAQLRASQNANTPQNAPFMNEQTSVTTTSKPDETPTSSTVTTNTTPDLEELHKLMQKEKLAADTAKSSEYIENQESQVKLEKQTKVEPRSSSLENTTKQSVQKPSVEIKSSKQKTKNKKNKEEKKEEIESKNKDEDSNKTEKKSQESSPVKNKKEDKVNKKELEKEKKEWIKEGFTIVKGAEKSNKDNKKKIEEMKVTEEAERKRKEEERLLAEEDRKRKHVEILKKHQEQQQQQQRQASESVTKKAPWSAVANQALQAINKDGLTLAEIQRLEKEKKLEQMKEQQQMMQIIAQQQAAALAREQEMQAGLGWAKKNASNLNLSVGQSLAEIQAETRKQAAAAAVAQAMEETQPMATPPINHVPWGNTHNGGFWDTQPNQPTKAIEKPQEAQKTVEQSKNKKKTTLNIPPKKESSPMAEFENWCTSFLTLWNSKIDVPTFIGFLKDIESPYEVKDYVKCYLGESKESSDFARQFLERRSKMLRVGMVTPSDDLCSPAVAVNPRIPSNSEYQEVKGKGKKTKKNKMLKVDARILGFSVTAAEDRINVGDIDTV